MIANEVVAERVKRRGITNAELGRRVNIHPELLRRSLMGVRPFKADELIRLSAELGLEMSDFYKAS